MTRKLIEGTRTLDDIRHAAADATLRDYRFDDDLAILATDGSEYSLLGLKVTRVVHLENSENPDSTSTKGYFMFVVEGLDSAVALEAITAVNSNQVAQPAAITTAPQIG